MNDIYTNVTFSLYKNRHGKWNVVVKWENQRKKLTLGAETIDEALRLASLRVKALRRGGQGLDKLGE